MRKNLWYIAGLALLIGSVSACHSSGQKQIKEGYIHYRLKIENAEDPLAQGLMPTGLEVRLKDNMLHLRFRGGTGDMKPDILVYGDSGIYALIEDYRSQVSVKPISREKPSHAEKGTEAVLQFACDRYTAHSTSQNFDILAAERIPLKLNGSLVIDGFFIGAFGKMPLRIVTREKDKTLIYEADTIIPGPQDTSIFRYPAGYPVVRKGFVK